MSQRDTKGRLLPGHTIRLGESKELAIRRELPKEQQVALTKEAMRAAVTDKEMYMVIRDILKTARRSNNPWVKKALYELLLNQVVGLPTKTVDVNQTSVSITKNIDYSVLTDVELVQLEALASKGKPIT